MFLITKDVNLGYYNNKLENGKQFYTRGIKKNNLPVMVEFIFLFHFSSHHKRSPLKKTSIIFDFFSTAIFDSFFLFRIQSVPCVRVVKWIAARNENRVRISVGFVKLHANVIGKSTDSSLPSFGLNSRIPTCKNHSYSEKMIMRYKLGKKQKEIIKPERVDKPYIIEHILQIFERLMSIIIKISFLFKIGVDFSEIS